MIHDPNKLAPFLSALSFDGPIEPFMVFGDWLEEQGDLWGEYINVSCALERAQARARLERTNAWLRECPYEENNESALETAARIEERLTTLRTLFQFRVQHGVDGVSFGSATWRRGFIEAIQFGDAVTPLVSHVDSIKIMLERPVAALVSEVRLHNRELLDDHGEWILTNVRTRLAEIDAVDLSRNRFSQDMVAELRAALPKAVLDPQYGEGAETLAPPPPAIAESIESQFAAWTAQAAAFDELLDE